MLTLTQNILILVFVMFASSLLLIALNWIWPLYTRHSQNDLIGWHLSVLGTTYAVVLGFMLFTAWTNFGAAELNADLEANALRNLFRLAEGLPQQQRTQLEMQARAYANAVVEQDWPAMARGQIPEGTHEINEHMWKTLVSIKVSSSSEGTAADHALSELSALTQHRRTRLLQCVSRIARDLLGCPPGRRHSDSHLNVHVCFRKTHNAHLFGIFHHPPGHTRDAGHRRCRSPVPRLGSCQQLRLCTSTAVHARDRLSRLGISPRFGGIDADCIWCRVPPSLVAVITISFAAPTDLILGAFEELQRGADAQSVPQSAVVFRAPGADSPRDGRLTISLSIYNLVESNEHEWTECRRRTCRRNDALGLD